MSFDPQYKLTKELVSHYKRTIQQLDERAKQNVTITKKNTTEHQQHLRKACLNFQYFVNYYFLDYVKNENGDIIPLAPFHIEVVEKFLAERRAKICCEWSRSLSKSTLVFFLCCWMIFRRYHNINNTVAINNVVLFSGSKDKAVKLLLNLRAQLEHNQLLIDDCEPFRKKTAEWTVDQFEVKMSGGVSILFTALSRDTDCRGLRNGAHRVDMIILDDCSDAELNANEERAEATYEKLMDGIMGATDINKSYRMLFMENAYSKNSLIRKFEHKLFETVKEHPEYASQVLISKVNMVDDDGNITWPERFSWDAINNFKAYFGITYEREFQQKDTSSGRYFKPNLIQFTDSLLSQYRRIITYYDPSTTFADFKAIITIGLSESMQFHILDLFVRQTDIEDAIKYMFDLCKRFPTTRIYIENIFNQGATHFPLIKQAMSQRGIYLPLYPDNRKKENKSIRIESLHPLFVDIYFDLKLRNTIDYDAFTEQMFSYVSNGKAHDDALDSLEGGLFILNQSRDFTGFNRVPVIGNRKRKLVY
jgi:hypothetical protein